jgi:hypothetical protein
MLMSPNETRVSIDAGLAEVNFSGTWTSSFLFSLLSISNRSVWSAFQERVAYVHPQSATTLAPSGHGTEPLKGSVDDGWVQNILESQKPDAIRVVIDFLVIKKM